MGVSVGADSFSHPVRFEMSLDMSGKFSSGTAGLISSAKLSKKLLMSLRSSSISSAKSIRMGITFAAKTGFFAILLSKSRALFNTSPRKLMYSFNF